MKRGWLVDEDGEIVPRRYPSVEFWVKLKDKGENKEE